MILLDILRVAYVIYLILKLNKFTSSTVDTSFSLSTNTYTTQLEAEPTDDSPDDGVRTLVLVLISIMVEILVPSLGKSSLYSTVSVVALFFVIVNNKHQKAFEVLEDKVSGIEKTLPVVQNDDEPVVNQEQEQLPIE